ncbi:DUF87 domain-containing protein [Fructobacillus sp. M158]|uniref:ATP-binding protein n=1 Tax=Fructobacillus parabroussonetiae TaxID=2713174 RepID=UPI00200B2EB0|nr:DUF87 domain-containing protein [Fructobacillus parabroussonetiae]MCK8617580.1 DUF87 domain-containing protein [Fructobacillus parabroussonetiae]
MENRRQVKLFLGQGAWHRPCFLPYDQLLAKHLLILGQTGAGKSTSAKQMIGQLQEASITNIIFDPTGEYKRDIDHSVTYKVGENGYIDLRSRSAEAIVSLLGLHWSAELIAKLQAAITSLRIQATLPVERAGVEGLYQKVNRSAADYEKAAKALTVLNQDYDMALLAKQLVQEFVRPFSDERADYRLLGQELDHDGIQRHWAAIQELQQRLDDGQLNRIFHFHPVEEATTQYELSFILQTFEEKKAAHRSLIVDLSALQFDSNVQQSVLSDLMDNILMNRLASSVRQPVAIILDEAHRYLNLTRPINENGLFHLLREGRKINLNLAISTQSQEDLPLAMRGQFASLLIHRYPSTDEFETLGLSEREGKKVARLAVGRALLKTEKKHYFLKIKKPQ